MLNVINPKHRCTYSTWNFSLTRAFVACNFQLQIQPRNSIIASMNCTLSSIMPLKCSCLIKTYWKQFMFRFILIHHLFIFKKHFAAIIRIQFEIDKVRIMYLHNKTNLFVHWKNTTSASVCLYALSIGLDSSGIGWKWRKMEFSSAYS